MKNLKKRQQQQSLKNFTRKLKKEFEKKIEKQKQNQFTYTFMGAATKLIKKNLSTLCLFHFPYFSLCFKTTFFAFFIGQVSVFVQNLIIFFLFFFFCSSSSSPLKSNYNFFYFNRFLIAASEVVCKSMFFFQKKIVWNLT